jgi:hypothetical protein
LLELPFVRSAFAQEDKSGENRELVFASAIRGNLNYFNAKDVLEISAIVGAQRVFSTEVPLGADLKLPIPANTEELEVTSRNTGVNATIKLPPSTGSVPTRVLALVVLAPTASGDAQWAFGGARSGSVREIDLSID